MVTRAIFWLWLFYAAAVLGVSAAQLPCQFSFCGEAEFLFYLGTGLGMLIFAVFSLRRLQVVAPELFRRPHWREFGLPLWSIPVSLSFAVFAFNVLPQAQGNVVLPAQAGWEMLLPIWLVVAVIVPFAEESLFRGWIFRGFRLNDGLRTAVWFSAVLFGLAHVLPAVVVYAFGAGLIWGRYMALGGSIWVTIFAHAVGNSIPFALLLFGNFLSSEVETQTAAARQPDPIIGVGFLLFGLALVWLFFSRNPLPQPVFEAKDPTIPKAEQTLVWDDPSEPIAKPVAKPVPTPQGEFSIALLLTLFLLIAACVLALFDTLGYSTPFAI